MPSDTGRCTVTVVPAPGTLTRSSRPPTCCTARLTTSMPTPRPDTVVTSSAVDRPGAQDQPDHLLRRHAGELVRGDHPSASARAATASLPMPAPSSDSSMRTCRPPGGR